MKPVRVIKTPLKSPLKTPLNMDKLLATGLVVGGIVVGITLWLWAIFSREPLVGVEHNFLTFSISLENEKFVNLISYLKSMAEKKSEFDTEFKRIVVAPNDTLEELLSETPGLEDLLEETFSLDYTLYIKLDHKTLESLKNPKLHRSVQQVWIKPGKKVNGNSFWEAFSVYRNLLIRYGDFIRIIMNVNDFRAMSEAYEAKTNLREYWDSYWSNQGLPASGFELWRLRNRRDTPFPGMGDLFELRFNVWIAPNKFSDPQYIDISMYSFYLNRRKINKTTPLSDEIPDPILPKPRH